MILIVLALLFVGAEAKEKKQTVKVDPEFEQFWKEFQDAVIKNDKTWFENFTAFPIVTQAECEAMGSVIDKKDFFDDWHPFSKSEIKKISKLKATSATDFKKNKDTYSSWSEDQKDPATHIPNGSMILTIGFKDKECYQSYYFAKINNRYKYIGYGSCCEGGE